MAKTSRVKIIGEIIVFFLFALIYSAHASIPDATPKPSMFKAMIEGSEIKGEKISKKEYKLNDKYIIKQSLLSNDFHSVVSKLDNLMQKKEYLKNKLASQIREKIAEIRKERVSLLLAKQNSPDNDDVNQAENKKWEANYYANVLKETNLRNDYEKKLMEFNDKNTVLLEYINLGDGKKVITNIAIASAND